MELGALLTIPVLVFYLLRDRETWTVWVMYCLPSAWRPAIRQQWQQVHLRLQSYLCGQVVSSIAVGLLVGTSLTLFGIPYAAVLGVISAMTNLIPFVGPFIGGTVICLVSLTQGMRSLWVGLAVAVLAQQAESLLITPRVVGGRLAIHPMAVTLSVIAGSLIAGLAGMLLAIPLVILGQGAIQVAVRCSHDHKKFEQED